MKIRRVLTNNRKKVFVIEARNRRFEFPYSQLRYKPSAENPVVHVAPDSEIGNEGFSYRLRSGKGDTIHIDSVLEYNKDPDYLCELLLHNLTVSALDALGSANISKRELARRLQTSPKQLYRLLDPAFYGKTINQMVRLLHALGCSVELVLKKAA